MVNETNKSVRPRLRTYSPLAIKLKGLRGPSQAYVLHTLSYSDFIPYSLLMLVEY